MLLPDLWGTSVVCTIEAVVQDKVCRSLYAASLRVWGKHGKIGIKLKVELSLSQCPSDKKGTRWNFPFGGLQPLLSSCLCKYSDRGRTQWDGVVVVGIC